MKTPLRLILAATAVLLAWSVRSAPGKPAFPAAQSREATVVDSAAEVLDEIMAIPGGASPQASWPRPKGSPSFRECSRAGSSSASATAAA